jgi:hypothetical protein
VTGRVLELRARQDLPKWPMRRRDALRDERRWIASLDDRELAQLCAGLYQVDKAVKAFRKSKRNAA